MKRVLSAPNAAEAHVAVAKLESVGIEATTLGEHMGALPLGPASRPSVWVSDEDHAAACEALGISPESTAATQAGAPPYRAMAVVLIALALMLAIQRC
jgi:putative signal transducing protein